MKKIAFVIVLILGVWGVNTTMAQEDIPTWVQASVDHLNNYLLIPLDLNEVGVEWDWEVLSLDDFGDNCRERTNQSAHLPTVAYDIHFYRLAESYHYRVSMDEQLIVACGDLIDVPADTLPALVDALDDLNRRFHITLTVNDLPWRWEETQFDDYTLACPTLTPPDDAFDQHIDGYIITFTLLGEQWEYRVSSDRLIVMLCIDNEEA